MITDIEYNASEIVGPIIQDMGYELVETSFKNLYGNPTLTFYVYKKGGISLSDCEAISAAIDGPLDKADITHGEFYHLNVSSLGLDRPIITEDDFRRSLDTDIEIVLNNVKPTKDKSKKTSVHGILKAYDDESVEILVKDTKSLKINKEDIKITRPYINFK